MMINKENPEGYSDSDIWTSLETEGDDEEIAQEVEEDEQDDTYEVGNK